MADESISIVKIGQQAQITTPSGTVLVEMRTDAKGRPRIAIRAVREIRISFVKAEDRRAK